MGPLKTIRIIEVAGIGPGPFCGMLLGDLGAEVIRVERPGGSPTALPVDLLNRNRKNICIDLKKPGGVNLLLDLLRNADALIEGFRPGVMERLGLSPEVCLKANPKLVYARVTGWGQHGPRARTAGHDINYIALSGVLHAIGTAQGPPVVPLNLVGDFGGGGMLLALGILAGVINARGGGSGQVVDAAMVDGASLLATMFHGLIGVGMWTSERGVNLLDGGAPFYGVYETADGAHVALGAIEPKFYEVFLEHIGVDTKDWPNQYDQTRWPELKAHIAAAFKSRSRAEWVTQFHGTDACVSPVLSFAEAHQDPHNQARDAFVNNDELPQPSPAPRFSSTPNQVPTPPSEAGAHTDCVLESLGISATRRAELHAARIIS